MPAADELLATCWTTAGDAAPSRDDWWSVGPERARSEELRRFMLTAAEALGARHLKVTPDTSGAPWDAGWAGPWGSRSSPPSTVGSTSSKAPRTLPGR